MAKAQVAALATIGTAAFRCLVCANRTFTDRQIKLNTTGMEFMGWEWANKSAQGLICLSCGYVHEFVGDQISLWNAEGGYPAGTTDTED